MTDKNGGGAKQPQGDPNASTTSGANNDFTANENAIGQAPNNRPANQTEEQTNGQ